MKEYPAKVGNEWYTLVELFTADGPDEGADGRPAPEVTVVATSDSDPLKSFVADLPANWRQIPAEDLSPLLTRALESVPE